MERVLTTEEFNRLQYLALSDCDALDMRTKLADADVDSVIVDVATAFERERRAGKYITAIYNALESHQLTLDAQRSELDSTLDQLNFILGKTAPETKKERIRPVLTDDLLLKLSVGNVDQDTFVETALAYGHSQNISSRTYFKLKRRGSSHNFVALDKVFTDLMEDDDTEGTHPLLNDHGFGHMMLEVTFDVGDAYLTAVERRESSD